MNIITIDGPSASGKGTIAKKIAKKLNFEYLDSGSLYRLISYIALKNNYTLIDINILIDKFHTSQINFTDDKILLNNIDISEDIRSEEVGSLASKLATKSDIRNELLVWQRKYALNKNLITDGRDMGTVVFPDAICKIFLVADVKQRALRRHLQLKDSQKISYEEILKSLIERDDRDINRAIAPLKPALDAIIIDNTYLSIDETIEIVLKQFEINIGK